MNNRWQTLLPLISVLALAFALSFVQIDDLDVWWHLKCGELLAREGRILREDIFSYTAYGKPWVDGYLPVQSVMYILWNWLGAAGITLFNIVVVVATYSLALAMSNRTRAGFGAALAASIPALILPRIVFIPRPALLSPIFALVTLYLLESYSRTARLHDPATKIKRIYWLIPLTALWANCHPGFLVGPLLTFVYLVVPAMTEIILAQPAIARLLKVKGPKSRGKSWRREKELLFVLTLQLAATLLNPYGYKVYYSTLSFAQSSGLRNVIFEWMPMLHPAATVPPDTIIAFIILSAFGLACALYRGRRSRPEHIFLFAFWAISAFYGRRNVILFGPLSLPLISWIISDKRDKWDKWGQSPLFAAKRGDCPHLYSLYLSGILKKAGAAAITLFALFMIWFSVTDRFYFYTFSLRNTGFGSQPDLYPEGAVELLRTEKVAGNLFHSYDMGGYLIFKLYPQYRVFIDGRIYPYSLDLFYTMGNALVSYPAFNYVVKGYDIRAFIAHMDLLGDWVVIKELIESKDWAAVYADGSFVLFLRRGVGNDSIIQRHEIDLLKHPPALNSRPPGRPYRMWDKAEIPSGPTRWTLFYSMINKPELAVQTIKLALNYRPFQWDLYTWYGGLLVQTGSLEEGFAVLQESLKHNPTDIMALRYLADYFIKKKDFDQTEELLLRASRLDPSSAEVWSTLGEIAFNRQDYGTAAKYFRKATTLRPDQRKYWEKLGISLQFFDEDEAKKAFARANEISTSEFELPGDVARVRDQVMKMRR